MNIVLIGFMGTGKSTIGKLLAKQLDFQFVDVDARIEDQAGKSITEIFQSEGEGYFRKLETEIAEKLSSEKSQVIATGGGFVLNPQNIAALKSESLIISLKASPLVIYERIKNEKHRPLLAVSDPLARINQLLQERATQYRDADVIIDTEGKTPSDIVAEIGVELMKRGFYNGRNQAGVS
jgi:shikimate kinase